MDLQLISEYLESSKAAEKAAKMGCTHVWAACWDYSFRKWQRMTEEEQAFVQRAEQ